MARACSMHWERREMHTRFWWENQIDRSHYEDLDLDGRILLKLILQK
jgi:hypothetical protein